MATRTVSTQLVLTVDERQRLAGFFTLLMVVERRTRASRRRTSSRTATAQTQPAPKKRPARILRVLLF